MKQIVTLTFKLVKCPKHEKFEPLSEYDIRIALNEGLTLFKGEELVDVSYTLMEKHNEDFAGEDFEER